MLKINVMYQNKMSVIVYCTYEYNKQNFYYLSNAILRVLEEVFFLLLKS